MEDSCSSHVDGGPISGFFGEPGGAGGRVGISRYLTASATHRRITSSMRGCGSC